MEREKQKKEEKAKLDAEREELRKKRLAEQEQAAAEGKTVVESKWTVPAESREPSDEETEVEPNEALVETPSTSPIRKGPVTIKEALQDILSKAPAHMHEELQASLSLTMFSAVCSLLHLRSSDVSFQINAKYAFVISNFRDSLFVMQLRNYFFT